MEQMIRALCAISVFCGAALSLCPEGAGKRTLSFACSVVILACALSFLRGLDWQEYATEAARLREREEEFLQQNGELRDRLDRLVIEEQYRTYILNTARELGLPLREVRILAQWSLEGFWVPDRAILSGELTEEERAILAARLETDLGIPRGRQEWTEDGG